MTAIIVTTPDQPNRTAVTLDSRLLGHIIDTGYGYWIADVRQVHGKAVPIIVDTYEAGLALFMSLTALPVGEECFSGFWEGQGVIGDVYVREGEPTLAALAMSRPHDEPGLDFGLTVHLDAEQLRALAYNLSFALARLAVTS